MLRDPAIDSRLAADGVTPAGRALEHFEQVTSDDMERWRRLARQKDIKAE